MADSYIQLPADSTGKRLRTRTKTIDAVEVHEQATYRPGTDTWMAIFDNIVHAANKQMFSVMNNTGSGKVVQIRKIFRINATAAVTGTLMRYDFKKITTATGGTLLTTSGAAAGAINSMDTANTALPSQIEFRTGATVTEGNLLWPHISSTEEQAATSALSINTFEQYNNLMPEHDSIQEYTLREGQGMTCKQISAGTTGTPSWLIVFTVIDP